MSCTTCCFSLLAHLPKGSSSVDWIIDNKETTTSTSDDYDDDDENDVNHHPTTEIQNHNEPIIPDKKHIILMEQMINLLIKTKHLIYYYDNY